ncbi:MAG TPA: hypothetical protein VFJ19_09335 [Nocardioidaceae bacterium]|nr:hypothetical protein [Nocardioidaceae bacterium]
MAARFVLARNDELGVEKLMPASSLPYKTGWYEVEQTERPAPKKRAATKRRKKS